MIGKASALEKSAADVQKKLDETGLGDAGKKAPHCKGLEASSSSSPTS
jgi:hypothetical protein